MTDNDIKTLEINSAAVVKQRDRYTCVVCGKRYDEVHEIMPRGALQGACNANILFSEKNRVCLCRACHSQVATDRGRIALLEILHLRYRYDYSELPFRRYREVRLR